MTEIKSFSLTSTRLTFPTNENEEEYAIKYLPKEKKWVMTKESVPNAD